MTMYAGDEYYTDHDGVFGGNCDPYWWVGGIPEYVPTDEDYMCAGCGEDESECVCEDQDDEE